MRLIIITVFIAITFGTVRSQNIVKFTYDPAGNRVTKEIVMSTKSAVEPSSIFTEELAERIIKIYPNPTQGLLKFELSDISNTKTVILHLLNMNGQSILKTKMVTNPTEIDISNRPNGFYILQIAVDEKISTWKIIKK